MARRPRRNHSPQFKAKVALEAVDRGVVYIDDYRWRKHCRGLIELPVAA